MQSGQRLRRSRSLSFSEKSIQCLYFSNRQPVIVNKPRENKPNTSNSRYLPSQSKQTYLNIIIQQQNQTSMCANSPRNKEIMPRIPAAEEILALIPLKFKKMLRILIDEYEKQRVGLMLQIKQKEDKLKQTEKMLDDMKIQMSLLRDDNPMAKLSNPRNRELASIIDNYFMSEGKMKRQTVQTPTTHTRNRLDQSFTDDFP